MGLITKNDLAFKDYVWTAYGSDNPKISGAPDSTLLSRKEGYEVLYFVNKFCELHKITNKSYAKKIELSLRNLVPSTIHSQVKIKEWIAANWNLVIQ